MAERNLTSLGTNINSPATQLMVMMPTADEQPQGLPGQSDRMRRERE